MRSEGEKVHVTETEASGGSKEGVVRWVLVIGTVLAIALLSIVWITGAATQDPVESEVNVSDRMQVQDDGSTVDSVTGTEADDLETPADAQADDTPLQTVEN